MKRVAEGGVQKSSSCSKHTKSLVCNNRTLWMSIFGRIYRLTKGGSDKYIQAIKRVNHTNPRGHELCRFWVHNVLQRDKKPEGSAHCAEQTKEINLKT